MSSLRVIGRRILERVCRIGGRKIRRGGRGGGDDDETGRQKVDLSGPFFLSLFLSAFFRLFFHDWLHIGDVGYMRIPFRCNKFR